MPSRSTDGSSKNLFYRFRRFDNRWRVCRLLKGRQRGVDHCRFNHWGVIARSCVSVARTSRDWFGDCAYCIHFARCAVCPEISADRKSDACGNDVDPERDRDHCGHRRLGKKVITWEEFAFGRGGGL